MAGLAVTVMQMIDNSQKAQKNVQNSLDFDVLKSSIKQVLDKADKCATGLKNAANTSMAKFNPTSAPNSTESLGAIVMGTHVVAKVGDNLGGGLKLTKLELISTDTSPPSPDASGNSTHNVKLIIEAQKTSGSIGGLTLTNANNPFLFSLKTDSSNQITACGGAGLEVSQICLAMGGTWHADKPVKCKGLGSGGNNNKLIAQFTVNGSYNWSVPSDVKKILVEVIGAGGSSGGTCVYIGLMEDWAQDLPSGGGGGAFSSSELSVSPGQAFKIIVGKAASGAKSGHMNLRAEPGSPSSFQTSTGSTLILANGGQGGCGVGAHTCHGTYLSGNGYTLTFSGGAGGSADASSGAMGDQKLAGGDSEPGMTYRPSIRGWVGSRGGLSARGNYGQGGDTICQRPAGTIDKGKDGAVLIYAVEE